MYVLYVVIQNLLAEIGAKTTIIKTTHLADCYAIGATLVWGTSEITLSTSSQQLTI
jgi:hypothetical protein